MPIQEYADPVNGVEDADTEPAPVECLVAEQGDEHIVAAARQPPTHADENDRPRDPIPCHLPESRVVTRTDMAGRRRGAPVPTPSTATEDGEHGAIGTDVALMAKHRIRLTAIATTPPNAAPRICTRPVIPEVQGIRLGEVVALDNERYGRTARRIEHHARDPEEERTDIEDPVGVEDNRERIAEGTGGAEQVGGDQERLYLGELEIDDQADKWAKDD